MKIIHQTEGRGGRKEGGNPGGVGGEEGNEEERGVVEEIYTHKPLSEELKDIMHLASKMCTYKLRSCAYIRVLFQLWAEQFLSTICIQLNTCIHADKICHYHSSINTNYTHDKQAASQPVELMLLEIYIMCNRI